MLAANFPSYADLVLPLVFQNKMFNQQIPLGPIVVLSLIPVSAGCLIQKKSLAKGFVRCNPHELNWAAAYFNNGGSIWISAFLIIGSRETWSSHGHVQGTAAGGNHRFALALIHHLDNQIDRFAKRKAKFRRMYLEFKLLPIK